MMSRRFWIAAWLVTVAAVAISLLRVIPPARRAAARARADLATLALVTEDALALTHLRPQSGRDLAREHPDSPKLAPAVSAGLAAAGLPASTLASLSPESASLESAGDSAAAARIVRKRATLVLTPITLPQLGRFLQTWHDRASESSEAGFDDWTFARLDLEPRTDTNTAANAPGSDLPLRVVMSIESVVIQPAPARAPR